MTQLLTAAARAAVASLVVLSLGFIHDDTDGYSSGNPLFTLFLQRGGRIKFLPSVPFLWLQDSFELPIRTVLINLMS